MAHICSDCHSVFSDWIFHHVAKEFEEDVGCPIHGCAGTVREVDDNLVALTLILEDKGYRIDVSNSGNSHGLRSTFVLFDYGIALPSLPEGFELVDSESNGGQWSVKKSYGAEISPVDVQKEIFKAIAALLDWAVALPHHSA